IEFFERELASRESRLRWPPPSFVFSKPDELPESSSAGRAFDEPLEPLEPRLFLLTADHPPGESLLVAGWLGFEERPRPLVLPEDGPVGLDEVCRALLIGIDAGLVLEPGGERFPACGPHSLFLRERLDAADVDRAPDAAGPSGREPNDVALLVEALADSVDPAHPSPPSAHSRPGPLRLPRPL